LYITDNIINLKIFIDTDINLKIPWKIKRDIQKRNYTLEQIMKQINDRTTDYNMYILPQREHADIIINFYTTIEFNIDTFIQMNKSINDSDKRTNAPQQTCLNIIDHEIPVLLKIFIKRYITIDKIIDKINISNIEFNEHYYIFDFKENYDYFNVINTIIMNMY
jgi:phosphoribulokinase